MDWSKIVGALTHVRLSGGVFGKNGLVLIFLIVSLSVVATAAHSDNVKLAICGGIIVAVLYGIKRAFDFADKHPNPAIMDGAELVKHAGIVYGKKGASFLPPAPAVVDHEPLAISQFDPDAADPIPLESPKSMDQPLSLSNKSKQPAKKVASRQKSEDE